MAGRPKSEATATRSIRLKVSDWERLEAAASAESLSVNAYIATRLGDGAAKPSPAAPSAPERETPAPKPSPHPGVQFGYVDDKPLGWRLNKGAPGKRIGK